MSSLSVWISTISCQSDSILLRLAETSLSCQLGGNVDSLVDMCIYDHALKRRCVADGSRQDVLFCDTLHNVAVKVGIV